jgi:hypothetical protein
MARMNLQMTPLVYFSHVHTMQPQTYWQNFAPQKKKPKHTINNKTSEEKNPH